MSEQTNAYDVWSSVMEDATTVGVIKDGQKIRFQIDSGYCPDGQARLSHLDNVVQDDRVSVLEAVPRDDGRKLRVKIEVQER